MQKLLQFLILFFLTCFSCFVFALPGTVNETISSRSVRAEDRLATSLPELCYRESKYDILRDNLRLAETEPDPDGRLARWNDKSLESPFFLRDIFRMRFLRQKMLIDLLKQAAPAVRITHGTSGARGAAPAGLEHVSVWLGGEDISPGLGRFPWSSMSVALVPDTPQAASAAESAVARLKTLLNPVKGLEGHIRFLEQPGKEGIRTRVSDLLKDPALWMGTYRRLYESTGGKIISSKEWNEWVTIFTQRPREEERALLEYHFPELKEVMRKEAFDSLFKKGLIEPGIWERMYTRFASFQQIYRKLSDDTDALKAGLNDNLRLVAAQGLSAEENALYRAVADRYVFLGQIRQRRRLARAISPGAGEDFRQSLKRFFEIFPEHYYDRYNLIAFRDHELHSFALKHAKRPEDFLEADGFFSVEGFREYNDIVKRLVRLIRLAPEPGKTQITDNLRASGKKMAILALTILEEENAGATADETSRRRFLKTIGFLPFRNLRDMGRFLPGTDDTIYGYEAHGKVLQLFLESRFYDGLYVQAKDSLDEDLPYLKERLEQLLRHRVTARHYLITREFVRSVPHFADQDLLNLAKALSLQVDSFRSDFYAIRQNIHNHTSPRDVIDTRAFLEKILEEESPDSPGVESTRELLSVLEKIYSADIGMAAVRDRLGTLAQGAVKRESDRFLLKNPQGSLDDIRALNKLRLLIRDTIESSPDTEGAGKQKLALLDMDLALARTAVGWTSRILEHLPDQTFASCSELLEMFADGLYADGLMTRNERQFFHSIHKKYVSALKQGSTQEEASSETYLRIARRIPEWALANARLDFSETLAASRRILPEGAMGFLDNIVRSSSLQPFDHVLTRMLKLQKRADGLVHRIAGRDFLAGVRGLNPGFARAPFTIVDSGKLKKGFRFSRNTIYALSATTSELGPVAGVLSQDTGSSISHVQLLARNMGIPNASISPEVLDALQTLEGQEVIYIVKPGGEVWLDSVSKAADAQKRIESLSSGSMTKLTLPPVEENFAQIVWLNDISMADSGKKAGPKAANLGELHLAGFDKYLLPGIVIPFGVYARYAGTAGINREISRWISDAGVRENPERLAQELGQIRKSIENIHFDKTFVEELMRKINQAFKDRGLFVRSDTNVEDLPGFTGAGLNKTVPNVSGEESVLNAIRAVWASPWTERSFSWRENIIANLDYVFPSVLIMEAQAARKAGVMITMDIETGNRSGVFISAHEGLGIKVVDGSETPQEVVHDLSTGETTVLTFAKAREKLVLSPKGGVVNVPCDGDGNVLTSMEIRELARIGNDIRKAFARHLKSEWDIEWLVDAQGRLRIVQARPYVQKGWAE